VEDPMETAIKELPMVPEIDIRKLLYNGQFIILRGGRGYSIDGKEIN
jgi:hypothetical protein